MDLNDRLRQARADTGRWFPDLIDDYGHHSLALCGETGEIANKIKKVQRGTHALDRAMVEAIGNEMADSLVYIFCLAGTLGIDLEKMYDDKRTFNQRRFG